MPLISLVVPCYNEEESLPLFLQATNDVIANWPNASDLAFEVVLIDDGSRDNTLNIMREAAAKQAASAQQAVSAPQSAAKQASAEPWNFDVRYLSFSRNFGKEAAFYAGLEHAKGDFVATMDADMQDPPQLLPQMYELLQTQDVDNVATHRVNREGEPPIRSAFARLFYKLINKMSDADIVDGARDFRLMKRSMVDAILSMKEYNRFSKGIYGWVGFRTHWLPFQNVERIAGETHWSFWSLFVYALDGITAFSTAPLAMASVVGLVVCLVALLAIIWIVVKTLLFGDPVGGWPSTACLIAFLGGMQLMCLGVLGQYLAKTYLETKRRPIYIARESNMDD